MRLFGIIILLFLYAILFENCVSQPTIRNTTTTTPAPTEEQCDFVCENFDDGLNEVAEQMEFLGYECYNGYFEPYDPETSNVYIPFAKPDTDYLVAIFEPDGEPFIRFGGQDAIVWRGCTPPEVTYFGYRSYSAARILQQDGDNNPTTYTILEASLGDSINQLVINTESNDDTSFPAPWDRKTNIVTTGDKDTYYDVETAFQNAGLLNEMSLNTDVISNGILSKFGIGWFKYSESELDVPRDTIAIVIRVQFECDTDCDKDRYINNQSWPFKVFYKDEKKPNDPYKGKLRPTIDKKQCRKANSEENRYHFNKGVSNIIKHIEKEYKYKFISNTELNDDSGQCKWFGDWWPPNKDDFVYIFKHGFYCLLYQKDCMFDNRDTYYSWNGKDQTLEEDDFYLIVGINPNNLSLSTTNSISIAAVTNPDNGNAFEIIDSVSDCDYEPYDLRDIIKCKKKKPKSSSSSSKKKSSSGKNDDDDKKSSSSDRRRLGEHFYHHKSRSYEQKDKYDCKELKDVFAVQVTRESNAIDGLPSMIPSTDELAIDQRFIFFGEATLNPKTATMPDGDCLISWRLLKFSTKGCKKNNYNDYNNA